jgi:type VI secretion system protein
MLRRALLSRIGGPTPAPVDDIQSILAHLRVLLNTRQGDAPCVPRYGVIDFNDIVHGFPGSVPEMLKSIQDSILEHEPRLKNPKVRHVPNDNPLVLRFEISAQLVQARSSQTLRLSTTVRPGGRIDIAG